MIDRRGKLAEQPFDVQVTRDKVLVRFRGRLVHTLTGADADEIRAAVASGDPAAVLTSAFRIAQSATASLPSFIASVSRLGDATDPASR